MAPRPGPQASADLAELIAELPEGMRATLVQAAQVSHEVSDAACAGVSQDPLFDEDRMLTADPRGALVPGLRATAPWPRC
jgi:hypothetical protein